MCGIAGAFRQHGGRGLVETMTDRLAHRGPDADGIVEVGFPDAPAVLGHRRLSIIDLSTSADQPFVKDGYALVFNGEIYNYEELRARLVDMGVTFLTHSDTEVLLEAWRAWGPAALPRLRGMFAFALHEKSTGDLVLARDPLGIKPLYVLPRGDGVLFASELKALVTAVGPELVVDPAGLVASTLYYWLPPDRSPIVGVEKLTAGTWVEYHRDGSSTGATYWDPVEVAARAAAGERRSVRRSIEESVTAHLVADVKVNSFLSGGLDSSLITAIALSHNPDLEAYTIAFRPEDQRIEAMPNDAKYARMLAEHLGCRLHEITIEPDVVELLPRMVDVLDEPIGDPAAINTLLMCEAARDAGVKVLLSGMGADELFGGYRKHLACLIAARYRKVPSVLRSKVIGPIVRRAPVIAGGRGIRSVRWAQRFVSFADLPEEAAFRRSYTMYDPEDLCALIDPEMSGLVDAEIAAHQAVYEDNALPDVISRMCLTDTRLFMQGLNLTYTDRASMAASTEVRVPFVDTDVFETAFSLPGTDKIAGRSQKAALKQAARAWLPDTIIDRPKGSFGAPLRAWVTRDLTEVIDETLMRGQLVSSGILQAEPLATLVAEQRSGRSDQSKQIWQLLTLEVWCRHMLDAGVRLG
ncbi:MAG: asparagine synthase (glutamine-hydrolyzing) [Actinomycetales bacterium]|nr:MAG: asparagine synthase (glutamine-hydrolyzing) [Actinomycetales bacterium]